MSEQHPHLKTLEEIERDCVPSLIEVLRRKGIEGVLYASWGIIGWHRDYAPRLRRSRANEQRKHVGSEMWVRIEKIISSVPHEARRLQVEEGPEVFYKSSLD